MVRGVDIGRRATRVACGLVVVGFLCMAKMLRVSLAERHRSSTDKDRGDCCPAFVSEALCHEFLSGELMYELLTKPEVGLNFSISVHISHV